MLWAIVQFKQVRSGGRYAEFLLWRLHLHTRRRLYLNVNQFLFLVYFENLKACYGKVVQFNCSVWNKKQNKVCRNIIWRCTAKLSTIHKKLYL